MKPFLITLAIVLWLASIVGAFIGGAAFDSDRQLGRKVRKEMEDHARENWRTS